MKRVPWWYLSLYALLILAGLPLIFKVVPPNRWYGFRLPGAMISPEVWYDINALGGKMLIGSMVLCAALNLLMVNPATDRLRPYLGWINMGLVVLSFWIVSRLLLEHLP